MQSRKTSHPCFCAFVPPHVLENIARASGQVVNETVRDAARLTMMQDNQIRAARAAQVVGVASLVNSKEGLMAPQPGTGGRSIFSCVNKWEPPYVFERGEGDPVTADEAGNAAYDVGGGVRDYYKNKLGRNSIDNLGLNQVHNVHYGVEYMNAFWFDNQMTYGDGDGTIFINFTKDPDVIAHELTHGVTQYTAGLVYQGQSGALNEHFSDVFGTVIQQAIEGKTADDADWLMGDGIMGPFLAGEALRSMKAPGTAYDNGFLGKDPQPDHMAHYFYGAADNQGVHINSGIPNKVFYLVATDIGTDKAAGIWYATLQSLWPNALFGDFAYILADAASLATRNKQAPVGTTQTVRAALREVGL